MLYNKIDIKPFLLHTTLIILSLWQFHAFDFREMTRSEPYSQLVHCLYLYPLSVNLSRKRNMFIRVELRKDTIDISRQPLEVLFPQLYLNYI